MEIFDLYDMERTKLNATIERKKKLPESAYRMVVHVCIFNSQNEMLIQQRQSDKGQWPNMWDISVGGCVMAGENSRQAAEREVFEEIGYKVNLQHTRPHFTINFETGFDDIFLMQADLELSSLTKQEEEVQDIKWASKDEILQLLEKKQFIPYYKSFIEFVFETKTKRGLHTN